MTPEINLDPVLSQFKNTKNERGAYKNIPIDLLGLVRRHFKAQGIKIRVRYRGDRNNPQDTRYHHARMQDCLKQFADRFTVYYE
jgi:hypothetical protein